MRALLIVALSLALAPAAAGQTLEQRINELFIFGPGELPLFLGGSGDPNNPASLQVHGKHFIPAASASNATA